MEYLTQSMVFGPKTGMSLPNVTVENADMLNVDTAFGVGTKSTESAFANSFVGNIRKAGSDWSTLPATDGELATSAAIYELFGMPTTPTVLAAFHWKDTMDFVSNHASAPATYSDGEVAGNLYSTGDVELRFAMTVTRWAFDVTGPIPGPSSIAVNNATTPKIVPVLFCKPSSGLTRMDGHFFPCRWYDKTVANSYDSLPNTWANLILNSAGGTGGQFFIMRCSEDSNGASWQSASGHLHDLSFTFDDLAKFDCTSWRYSTLNFRLLAPVPPYTMMSMKTLDQPSSSSSSSLSSSSTTATTKAVDWLSERRELFEQTLKDYPNDRLWISPIAQRLFRPPPPLLLKPKMPMLIDTIITDKTLGTSTTNKEAQEKKIVEQVPAFTFQSSSSAGALPWSGTRPTSIVTMLQ
jgi:hypothetical protein